MRRTLATVALCSLVLAGCGGDDGVDDDRARTLTAPSPTAAEDAAEGTGGKSLTEAELKAALLTVQELPTGYTLDTSPDDDDDDGDVDGASKECSDRFKALSEANDADKSSEAEVSFEGGFGVILEQSLESYEDDDVVEERFDQFVEVLNDCPTFTQTDEEGGKTEFTIGPLSFPKLGDDTIALNIKFATSDFNGALNLVTVRLGRNVMSVTQGGLTADAAVLEEVARTGLNKLAAATG
jgi:hypothetical protein